MKQDAFLYRYAIICGICGGDIHPGQEVEWDHVHSLVMGGSHVFTNLRPVHADPCHKRKSALDVKANAKVKRLRGLTCNGPKKKIQSRGFDKTKTRKFSGEVVAR
jgi:hypothetical protein